MPEPKQWYAVVKPPGRGEMLWAWGVNDREPHRLDFEYPISFGHKWGHALTRKAASRAARRRMRWLRWKERRGGGYEAFAISLESGTDEDLQRQFNKIQKELSRRKAL